MKRKREAPKERNPVAAYAKRSGSGAHGRTKKALRRADKVALRKEHQGPEPTVG